MVRANRHIGILMIKLSVIVAKSQNGVIGLNNQMPWHIPQDLKYFKQVTMDKPIVMGRKTFDSIGRPLPGRKNIVVSRQSNLELPPEVALAGSIQQALGIAQAECIVNNQDEAMLIGGAEIYRTALEQNYVQRIYLTQIHAEIHGDTFFTEIQPDKWQEVSREDCKAEGSNPYDYSFIVLDKKES